MENPRPRSSSSRIKPLGRLGIGVAAFLALVSAGVAIDAFRFPAELPVLASVGSQRVLDRYGQEIRHALSVGGERRYLAPLEAIPSSIRDAFIEAEDRRFYTHSGVDARALARGLYQSARQLRKVSGGSTITMQLVRELWPELRSARHKPAQILQALRLEARYPKSAILTQYLNTVAFGNRISGVGAACRYFFDRTCDQLSPGQVAALAILPRNPSLFLRNPAALGRRRNALLDRTLFAAEATVREQAKAEPIAFARANPEFYAPHLTERILEDRKGEAEIPTTIDLGLQKSIEALLAAETEGRRGTGDSGAVLVLDNANGEVLAYVGSPDYFDPEHGMVDGVRVLRSPGSALKPFVYELALENGWDLFSVLPDLPMLFSTQRAIYEPNNYGGNFSGPRTMREALGNSKNLPALYLTSRVGESRVLEHLRRYGFTSLDRDAAFYGVGLALGNGEVNLWDLTQAYSTLARAGVAIPATFYRHGPARSRRVVPEETAYLIADVLRDPEARREEFGRGGPLEFDYDVGAKTGTSSDFRDNWTVGFTRAVTVGIWRGNANSTPLAQRVSASHGTGPLFHKVMDVVHRYRAPTWLARPSGIATSRVCALSGMKPGKYCPLTRLEHHLVGREPRHECTFHRVRSVANCHGRTETIAYVELPPEYAEWAKDSRVPTLPNQLRERCGNTDGTRDALRADARPPDIVEPLDRTNYAIDPTMPLGHQQIRFALRGVDAANAVQVYVNDEPYRAPIVESEFFWPLERGTFKFYVKKGGQVSNAVQILVR